MLRGSCALAHASSRSVVSDLSKSRSVPKALSLWGIVTYATMLSVGAVRIFYPGLPEPVFMALAAPGILFEIVFGFWLLLKGVRRPAGLVIEGA